MTLAQLWLHTQGVLPEAILALALCAVILADMAAPLVRSRSVAGLTALLGVSLAFTVLCARLFAGTAGGQDNFLGMVTHDQVSVFFRLLLFLGTIAVIAFSISSVETRGYRQGEYYTLLLGALLGADFLVSANNLVLFVIGLETLSICSYVLAGYIKHERPSAEASLKYMLYGAVFSGVLMFGLGYLYGVTGTFDIHEGMARLAAKSTSGELPRLGVLLILLLVLAGLGFKIAMVPFHFWCPDVYQGAPTPVTAFLAVVSKSAGFGALLRIFLPFFVTLQPGLVEASHSLAAMDLPILFGVLSMVTMTFGNLVAIRQTDVKRLLAYSSIAHAGYLLMGMTCYNPDSIVAMLLYLFLYLFMTLGAFWIVIILIDRLGGPEISRFRGIAYKAPFLFTALFIFLISLTGIPPTAGFVGKLIVFKVVIARAIELMGPAGAMTPMAAFYIGLAIVGVLNSAVSLYYYMNIAKTMVFERPTDDRPLGDTTGDRVLAAAFAVPTLALLYFAPVLQLIQMAGN
jgi:NADH-quinone oxidoreductase subunit N